MPDERGSNGSTKDVRGRGQDVPGDDGATLHVPSIGSHDVESTGPRRTELVAGTTVGRYLVISELGRGGMGVVARAYDPKLQREVALKCVHPGALSAQMTARLIREAHAMAKVTHANVVSLYDAELEGDTVVLAMEYVQGPNLKAWLRSHARTWPQILEAFVQAGRGLHAAHVAGLLHRDFKPANVLMSPDGAKVTDFGLARLENGSRSDELRSSRASGSRDTDDGLAGSMRSGDGLAMQLTSASRAMGTPAYMAPEQHGGGPLTPAVDQYAFCVSLWQGLTGELPFVAARRSLGGLLGAKRAGPPAWPKQVHEVPKSVVAAIRRGLEPNPADRWPTMRELLDALAIDHRRTRVRTALAVAGVCLLGGAGSAAAVVLGADAQRCSGAERHLQGIWDDERREQARAAVLSVELVYAPETWARVEAHLDDYADGWTRSHTEACEATAVRQEQSAAVMDLRMACLRRLTVELGATVEQFAKADAKVVAKGIELVHRLPAVERCEDLEALRAKVRPPDRPDVARVVAELEGMIARARVANTVGDYERALAELDTVAGRVTTIDYPPIETEWALVYGDVLEHLGRYDEAEPRLERALRQALEWEQWEAARAAASQLTHLTGYRLRRLVEGLAWAEVAIGLGKHGDEADSRNSLAAVLFAEGRYADAEKELLAGLRLRERRLPPDHPDIASSRNNLGLVYRFQGRYAEAEAEFERAIEIRERAYGPRHPAVATARDNLAEVYSSQGRWDASERQVRLAMDILVEALGPEHANVAECHNNLGLGYAEQGRYAESEAEFRRAITVWSKALGPDHPNVADARANLGQMFHRQGDEMAAETELRAALRAQIEVLGPEHPNVATTRNELGVVLSAQRRFDDAIAEHRASLAIWERALGPQHPEVAGALENLGTALAGNGDRSGAREAFERALAIANATELPVDARGELHRAFADLLWASPEDRPRARSLMTEMLALAPAGAALDEVRAWLDVHRE